MRTIKMLFGHTAWWALECVRNLCIWVECVLGTLMASNIIIHWCSLTTVRCGDHRNNTSHPTRSRCCCCRFTFTSCTLAFRVRQKRASGRHSTRCRSQLADCAARPAPDGRFADKLGDWPARQLDALRLTGRNCEICERLCAVTLCETARLHGCAYAIGIAHFPAPVQRVSAHSGWGQAMLFMRCM